MYIYQAARQKQERKIKVIITVCFIAIVLFFFEYGKTEKWKEGILNFLYQEMADYCMPIAEYYEKSTEEIGWAERLVYFFVPALEQGREVILYQTQIESAFSYEMILALEAADENYVDSETGQVVGNTDIAEVISEVSDVQIQSEDGLLGQMNQISEQREGITGDRRQKAVTYSEAKLADFDYLIQNFYRIDRTTTINSTQLNAKEMLAKDMRLTHDATSPQILIYHTHSQEGYVDSVSGDTSTTVVGVGDYLTELLQGQYGLNVIHHKGEYDVKTRDDAYSLAGPAVEKILAENPSIEVVIDLHRDGVGEDTRLVTEINGVKMAKIMFVNGLSRTTSVGEIGYLYNPNLADNLAFSFQNQLVAAEYYPGLSRGVYLKGYRYNLHYCPKSLLVEVGAQTNTLQEALNAMVPLADILYKVVVGDDSN